jgi:hypothetical protein
VADDDGVRIFQLTLIHEEVERQVAAYQARVGRLDQRAGLLLAAGGIAVSLLGQQTPDAWKVNAIVLAVLAALAAVVALVPRLGHGLEPKRMKEQVYARAENLALAYLIDNKIEMLHRNRSTVTFKAIALVVGFIAFAGAAASVLISAMT